MNTAKRIVAGTMLAAFAAAAALAGEAPAPAPKTPQQIEADYLAKVAELAAALKNEDISKWAASDRQLEALCHEAAAPGKEVERVAAVKALLAQLQADLPAAGKTRIIRHIELIGGAEAVPALAALLNDKDLREPARRALIRNPSPAALDALREALPKAADEAFRIALIDAVGARRDAGSATTLIALATDGNDDVRTHAVEALARIGDLAAAPAIAAAMGKGSTYAKIRATEAYLAFADSLAAKGQAEAALGIYRSLLGAPSYVKCAALVGIGRAGSAKDVETLVAALAGNNVERGAVRDALVLVPDKAASAAIAARLQGAKTEDKAILLHALGKRGDESVLPAVLDAAKDQDEAVRTAAWQAMGDLKAKGAIPALVAALKAAKGAERDKAEWALSQVPGKEATDAIVAALQGADKDAKVVLLRSLGYRKDPATLTAMVGYTKDADADVQVAALRAMGQLGLVEGLPTILDALKAAQGAVRDAAIYALRRTRGAEATAAIVKTAEGAPPAVLAPVIEVLSWRADPAVKEILLAGLKSADPGVKTAALEGLARVQDPSAVPAIIAAAAGGQGAVRDAAVRAALSYDDAIIKADPKGAAAIFLLGLDTKIAPQENDRKMALRALGKAGGPDAVDEMCKTFRDRRVAGDAHNAVNQIAERLVREKKNDEAIAVYTTLLQRSNDRGWIDRTEKALGKLGVQGELPLRAGFVTRWWVCGPFPNPNNDLYKKQLPPEAGAVDLAADVAAQGVTCKWAPAHITDPAGTIDLNKLTPGKEGAASLLYAEITVPKAQDVLLLLGYEEGCVATLNGKKIHERSGSRFNIDDQRVKVHLDAGANKLLLKIVKVGDRTWSACARILGPAHEPVDFTQREK